MKNRICTESACVSEDCIKRLSLYLRSLKELEKKKVSIISSDKITKLLRVTPVQFRKDLSYFGEFGKRGVGYSVSGLIKELERILGIDRRWNIVLVGVGHLGRALLGFEGFSKFNMKIEYAFDCNKEKIGKVINGVEIKDVNNLETIVRKAGIKVGIITTVPQAANDVAKKMVDAGIIGILNFTPVMLNVSDDIFISNIDMACELKSLIFFIKQRLNI